MNKRILFCFCFLFFVLFCLDNELSIIRFSAMEAVRKFRRYTVKNLASQDNILTYNFKYCMVLKYISPLEFRFRWRNYTPKNKKRMNIQSTTLICRTLLRTLCRFHPTVYVIKHHLSLTQGSVLRC